MPWERRWVRAARELGARSIVLIEVAASREVEFQPYGTFERLSDMVGGGPFRLQPGHWTDDTSMALCMCESLLVNGSFNGRDIMFKFLAWFDDGHMSCTGEWYAKRIAQPTMR